jgi:hypothetical protein
MEKYNIENPLKLDWKKSTLYLRNKGIRIYGV